MSCCNCFGVLSIGSTRHNIFLQIYHVAFTSNLFPWGTSAQREVRKSDMMMLTNPASPPTKYSSKQYDIVPMIPSPCSLRQSSHIRIHNIIIAERLHSLLRRIKSPTSWSVSPPPPSTSLDVVPPHPSSRSRRSTFHLAYIPSQPLRRLPRPFSCPPQHHNLSTLTSNPKQPNNKSGTNHSSMKI